MKPMKDPMKTKNFYVLLALIGVSVVAVWITVSPTPTLNNIVKVTHKKISKLKSLQPILKKTQETEVNHVYLKILGFTDKPELFQQKGKLVFFKTDKKQKNQTTKVQPTIQHKLFTPETQRTGKTFFSGEDFAETEEDVLVSESQLPVIGSSVSSADLDQAIHLLNTAQKFFPTKLVIFFDLGLDFRELLQLRGHCNSSTSCIVKHFDFSKFPSHIQYMYMTAYRPLCIQTALRDYGSVIWVDPSMYFISDQMLQPLTQAKGVGVTGWTMSSPTSSLTHPKMFEYFKTIPQNFFFHRAVRATHLVLYNTPTVHRELMLPWVKCALTEDCINPMGAQDTGCNFNRRPFFLYSGCHHYDMSALNIILGLLFNYNVQKYSAKNEEKVFETLVKGALADGRNFSFIGAERYRFAN